jgi:hypothetical protein
MSAAATAAGYLYASGRLRGRNSREDEAHKERDKHPREEREKPSSERIRVAVMPREQEQPQAAQEKPKRTPKIEYRRKRVVTPG